MLRGTFATSLMIVSLTLGGAHAVEPQRERLSKLLDSKPDVYSLQSVGYPQARLVIYRDTDQSSSTFGLELCVFESPQGIARLRVKDLRVDKPPAVVYSGLSNKALAVMTGGFFGLNEAGAPVPIGLVKSEGKTLSRLHSWTAGGFVAASNKGIKILPVARAVEARKYSDVVQSKPILIENGRDGIRTATDDRFDRSAVAIDKNGGLYFIVLHEPAGSAGSLAEFSHLLINLRSSNGASLQWALAMDGGPGAHLFVPAISKHCGAGIPTYVPNALYIPK